MAKVLIIEDDKYIAAELQNWLVKDKFVADVSYNGEDGLYRLKHLDYDLAIVDWNLPDIQGIDICKLIRKDKQHIPLLMLTSRKDLADKIEGLDSGAMDYMVKPCALPELSARLRALLRRREEPGKDTISVIDICISPHSRQIFCGDNEIKLSPTEFDIVLLLASNQNKALDYKAIAAILGKENDETLRGKIKNYISIARKKLHESNSRTVIEYRNQEGYLLVEKS